MSRLEAHLATAVLFSTDVPVPKRMHTERIDVSKMRLNRG
jgi:hypothetical protein